MELFQDFVKQIDEQKLSVEGIYVQQNGKEIFSHRWTPDDARNIYSHTKSFLSIAVGIAIDDGFLSLEDKLADVFPEKISENGNPGLEKITLRHLLTMSSGFNRGLLMNADRRAGVGFPDYLAYMMAQPVVTEPGSMFCYSSGDSYLAARMLEEKTGVHLLTYMYEKVLRPLEIPWPIWECCPKGHPLGGGGMFLKLKDMAKLGKLCLDGGKWQGKRLVSEEWIRQATAKQIENLLPPRTDKPGEGKTPWHGQGYGYQFWMCSYPDSYRADGSYGQISLMLPKQQMVIALQCPEHGCFKPVYQILHETVMQL